MLEFNGLGLALSLNTGKERVAVPRWFQALSASRILPLRLRHPRPLNFPSRSPLIGQPVSVSLQGKEKHK